MIKSKATIKKHLRELRVIIETSNDPLLQSIAYEIETAVRWATEDVRGWHGLSKQAEIGANYIRRDVKDLIK